MRNGTLKYWAVPIILAAAIVGIAAWALRAKSESTANLTGQNSITITAVQAGLQKKLPKLALTGTIEGETSGIISAKLAGRIAEVLVEDGQKVEAGQPLLRLESTELANGVRTAEDAVHRVQASYDNALTDYNRYQALYKQKAIAQQQLDAALTKLKMAEADLSSAYASLSTAKQQYQDTVVLAPVSGVVANKTAVIGQVVSPGIQLMTVENIGHVYAVVNMEQKDMGVISLGMPAEITVDAYPGKVFNGSVEIINPAAAATNRMFRTKLKVDNRAGMLKPGMFVQAAIVTGAESSALFVPQSTIFQKQGIYYVYLVEDGKVKRQKVEPGITGDKFIEIKSGLQAGDWIAASNVNTLKDGDAVTVKE